MSRPAPLELLARRAAEHEKRHLTRRLVCVGPANGRWVSVQGRRCLLLASNDYLGLSSHPRLAEAALEATLTCGTGAGASRLISGTLELHLRLEEAIARFKEAEAALLFPTGYMANLGVLSSLAGPGDLIVSDQLNHASLIDACRLSRAQVRVYPHGDVAAAEGLLAQGPDDGLRLLVSDGVFSMDGDLAPLPGLLAAARRQGALLVIDDAHGTGVWGARGRGSLEHCGLKPTPETVMIGTFSKALGGLGGFAAGAREVIQSLVNGARSFIFTTAPPPAQVAVALAALGLVDDEPQRRDKLHCLAALLRGLLIEQGLTLLSESGPIVPVLVGPADRALALAQALWQQGVFAPAIRPPTVPQGSSRLRLAVSAAHEEEDMHLAARALAAACREAGL
ncbi:MAG: 8-amino-7-oxononanoate synthase [Desulfarculus sp.]|nr:MAG: 8-amino-7-oxononanoate synthase [Desulfarculus sp.]